MVDGEGVHAVFIAGVNLLRGFENQGDVGLLQTAPYTQIPYSFAIRFHGKPPFQKINCDRSYYTGFGKEMQHSMEVLSDKYTINTPTA